STEVATAVGEREGRDDRVARSHRLHVAADVLDDAEELMPGPCARVFLRQTSVRPKVRATHACMYDADDGVRRLLDAWVGNVLNANVAGAVKDGCTHERRG